MLDINDLKKIGTIIILNNEPHIVLQSQHARTAQRKAFVRTKLKNLVRNIVIEKTFNAGDKIEEANLEKSAASFLYRDKEEFHFMDNSNFEEFVINKKDLLGKELFLKEGLEVTVYLFNKKPVSIELPKKVELKVIEAPLAVRGDTQSRATKLVTLETGLQVNVPLFIKEGETIRINTETGEYVERV